MPKFLSIIFIAIFIFLYQIINSFFSDHKGKNVYTNHGILMLGLNLYLLNAELGEIGFLLW
jgi:hypothetical protein